MSFEGRQVDDFAAIVNELRLSLQYKFVEPRDQSELTPLDWALRLGTERPALAPLVTGAIGPLLLDATVPAAYLLLVLERAPWPIQGTLETLVLQSVRTGDTLATRMHESRSDGRSVLGAVVHLFLRGGTLPTDVARPVADVLGAIDTPAHGWPWSALIAAASAPDPWADQLPTTLAAAGPEELAAIAPFIVNSGSPLIDRGLDALGKGAPWELRAALGAALEVELAKLAQPLDTSMLAYLPDHLQAMALANQAERARKAALGPELSRRLGLTS